MSFGQTTTTGATLTFMNGQADSRLAYGRPYTPVGTENVTSVRVHARNTTVSAQEVFVGIYDTTSGRASAPLVHTVTISIAANTATADWQTTATTFQLLSTKAYMYGYVSKVNEAWELSAQSTASMMEFHSVAGNYLMPATWTSGTASGLDALIEIVTTPIGPAITTINGSNSITAGQTNIPSVSVNFTGLPVTITTNASGVTCSNIGGTTNAATFNIAGRVDGGLYPKSGTSVTFTFTNGAESGSLAKTIVKKADETVVILTSPLFTANTIANAILSATGRTVAAADEFYHTVPVGMSDLVITTDTDYTVTNAGTFDLWLYVAAGADAGKNYYYAVTIAASGAVTIGLRGLTSAGLTSSKITASGMTSSGL